MLRILCPSVIGRDDELEQIGEALDGAVGSSRGAVLFVAGEAGIGKSRLAKEAIARAREGGFSVLSGRATLAHSTVAFRPLTEALFSYFRDRGPPDLPELEPFRGALGRLVPEWRRADGATVDDSVVLLAEALLRLLRAVGRGNGCLLVLDDLHWADPESLSIVEYLAENLASEPVVCVCTVRSEEASPALGLVRALAARRTASMISLSRLAPEDTAAMALACLSTHELPDPVDVLLSASADGLPFFVEELLAGAVGSGALTRRGDAGWTVEGALEPDVPLTFLDSVDGRLRTMGDAADVLVAAAVLGRRFDWTLLPDVTGLPEKAVLAGLRAGVDAQLLVTERSTTGTFRFRHSLTRDAVIQRLLPMEWASLARTALGAVDAAHPGLPGEWCDLGARLAARAGDDERAAVLLLESGRRSRARGALASAEEAFGRAGALAHDAPAVAADAAEALCEALSLSGKVDQALDVGTRLGAALRSLAAPPERVGRVHLWLARAASTAVRWDVAEDHAERARTCAQQADDPELSAQVDVIAAALALARGDIERATALARSARTLAGGLGLHEVVCEALEVLGRGTRLRDLDEAVVAFGQALEIAEQHDLQVWRVRALFELGTIDFLAVLSDDRLKAARELAMAEGALGVAAHVDMMRAYWHLDHFEPDEVVANARRGGEVARRFRLRSLHALCVLAEAAVHGWQGRHDAMEAGVEEGLAIAGDEPGVAGVAWGLCRGTSSLVAENRARALGELENGMAGFRQSVTTPPAPARGLWALVRSVDDLDGDAACAEVRASGVLVHRMNRGLLHYAEAVLAGRAGATEQAERLAAAGDAELASVRWYRQLGRRLMAEAAIAGGWGDPAAWLREALVCFEEHGQERLVTACRSLLGKAGAPVPRRRPNSQVPAPLRQIGVTEREYEVLRLLAHGLANKEIAARLYMSPRTAERHIANMTVKAGLRTRSELVAFAARSVDGPA